MAVDDKVRSVERNEFLCREVVRIAAMLLMRHPTYQGVFMCGRHGSFFDVLMSGTTTLSTLVQTTWMVWCNL